MRLIQGVVIGRRHALLTLPRLNGGTEALADPHEALADPHGINSVAQFPLCQPVMNFLVSVNQ